MLAALSGAALSLVSGCTNGAGTPETGAVAPQAFMARVSGPLSGADRGPAPTRAASSATGGAPDRTGKSTGVVFASITPGRLFGGGLEDLPAEDRPLMKDGLCPPDMASIDDRYCVDRYEASLLEVLPSGAERSWSPYEPVDGHVVRAVSRRNVIPQGYISGQQAAAACARSGKRLCKPAEWRKACMGPEQRTYGYGDQAEPRRCNDHGRSPIVAALRALGEEVPKGRALWSFEHINRPELNQLEGTLARTGEHDGCTNGYGVYDMVGNLHEWVADPKGVFQGGYYQDTHLNGDGCTYRTSAHATWYHDYSTGFRCCADIPQ
jgi:hypothetical protein